MSAVDAWSPAVRKISERALLVGQEFGVEIALAWPLTGGEIGPEIIVAAGSDDRVTVQPDRVFQYAVRVGACGVVLSHNHLRDTGPSSADHAVTRRLVAAGHLLGIPLLASLVVEPSQTHDLVSDRQWQTAYGRPQAADAPA